MSWLPSPPPRPPQHPDPRHGLQPREARTIAFEVMRDHFLWVNLVSLGVVLLLSMRALALVVRRPIRQLLAAIRDIKDGSVPQPGGATTPRELRQIGEFCVSRTRVWGLRQKIGNVF